jgi:hypothetical protein
MADNVNIIVQDTINDIVVNAAVVVETIDINVQAAVDTVDIVANPNNYVVNINRIIGEQVQSDWDQADDQAPDYIKNKPTIPAAQVNSDWDATSGVAEILNKPTIPAAVTKTSDLINDGEDGVDPFITAADIPPVTGFVPYTGATDDVNLGTHDLTATQGTFATSGNPDTLTVNHSSGSGKALTITKGGAGEGIYVNKTSGSGNAVTIVGDLEATNLKRTGGTSSQFLKADGSVDSNTYFELPTLTSGSVLFSNGTTIAQDNAQLFWNDTNNRLGIGTATPAYKLTVAGTIDAGTNLIGNGAWSQGIQPQGGTGEFRFVNGTGGGFFFTWVQNNGVERMRLSSNNNLLINTTTDAGYRLDVNGTVRFRAQTTLSTDTTFRVRNSADNDSLLDVRNNGVATVKGAAQVISFNLTDRVYIGLNVNNNVIGVNNDNKLFIRSNGNLNIITVPNSSVIVTDSTSPSLTPSSKLTVESTTQGFLPPRMTTTQKNAIATPAAGLVVYDTTLNQLCTYDGTWGDSPFYQQSLRGVRFFTDFDSSVNFYSLVSLTGGTAAATQRLTNFVPNQTANQIGIAHYQTGTLATGWAMHITEQSANGQQFQFGGGTWMYESYIEVDTLSDATNRFRFISGFGNVASSGTETNGAFFTYDEGGVSNGTIASPNWQCVTTVGAVRTLTTTSVAVTTTWTKLRIIVNADATEVKFYIDGILVATHTTNIPVLPNRFKVKQMIAKSLGTGNRFVYCDYIFYENNLTTLR